ncbi:MAG: hypothetical protein AAF611_13065 [Bacteroidota bacterium]
MRNIKKKTLNLKKFTVASIKELESVKGKSGTVTTACSGKTYPPDICLETHIGC